MHLRIVNTSCKKILLPVFLACLFQLNTGAQTLTVNTNLLNFGVVYENSPDSLPLVINNNLGYDAQVTGIRFYTTYGQPAFSSGRSTFTIVDQTAETLFVKFSPRHNIFHNSEMVIENNSHRGNVAVDLTGQGRYSMTYYDSSENKSEEDLKSALQNITGNGYISLGYNPARDSMFMVIDNKAVNGQGALQNTIECIYTGRLAAGYTSRTDCQNNFSFNTEHTFPQGLFGSLEPMRSDLHHIFPTDDAANNVRASYPFGPVAAPSWQNGGSKYGNNIFEPRDAQKGITARAMLYFVIRYQNYGSFLTSQEGILRTWHSNFLPTPGELARNSAIGSMQQNRNPFIDYPQLLDRITLVSSLSSAAANPSADFTSSQIDYGFVSSSASHRYSYVIVNNGNQDIAFSNFILSPVSIFSFASGSGVNTILPPGEALTVEIDLMTLPSGPLNGSLQFNTSIPGQGTVIIPIHVDGASPAGMADSPEHTAWISPNPVVDFLEIRTKSMNYSVSFVDVAGREIQLKSFLSGSNKLRADVSDLAPGLYFVRILQPESMKRFMFIKTK